jgi:chromosome segregation ATPase
MATKKAVHEDTASAKETEQDVDAAGEEVIRLTAKLEQAEDDLAAEKHNAQAAASTHQREVSRLQDVITSLRTGMKVTTVDLKSPDSCLAAIIKQLQDVAIGGPAASLRQIVHDVADNLDHEGKATLREYAVRLRGAAEAVEQETSTLLL